LSNNASYDAPNISAANNFFDYSNCNSTDSHATSNDDATTDDDAAAAMPAMSATNDDATSDDDAAAAAMPTLSTTNDDAAAVPALSASNDDAAANETNSETGAMLRAICTATTTAAAAAMVPTKQRVELFSSMAVDGAPGLLPKSADPSSSSADPSSGINAKAAS
jgi:hypothetical protein